MDSGILHFPGVPSSVAEGSASYKGTGKSPDGESLDFASGGGVPPYCLLYGSSQMMVSIGGISFYPYEYLLKLKIGLDGYGEL